MGIRETIGRWLSVKQSAAVQAIVSLVGRRAVWTPRDYAKLAKEGYAQNVWGFACINQIAVAAASVPWLLQQTPTTPKGKVVELASHPLLSLIRRPNPEQGQAAFITSLVGYLEASGNSYVEGVGPSTGTNAGRPLELWTLRPDRMKVVPDPKERIGGYEYTAGGFVRKYQRAQIMHVKLWNPLHDWYGMSPMEAAARSIDQGNEAEAFEVALLQNGAVPSGILTSDGALTDTQFERLTEQWKSEHAGTRNAGSTPILEAGLSYKPLSLDPEKLGIADTGKWSAAKVCAAFRCPGELVGLMPATYQNREEAKKALYTEVVLPVLDLIRDDFNNWLAPMFGDNLRLDYDTDSIEALREDQQRLYAYIEKASWLTINDKRRATQYADIPGGDVILVPANVLPLGDDVSAPPAEEVPAAASPKA